jgi:hypothetical protein
LTVADTGLLLEDGRRIIHVPFATTALGRQSSTCCRYEIMRLRCQKAVYPPHLY